MNLSENEDVVDMDEVSKTEDTDVDDAGTEPDATLGEDTDIDDEGVEPDSSISE